MKQITLNDPQSEQLQPQSLCLGRLFLIWLLYGVAVLALWRLAGDSPWAQTATWGVAGLAALALVLGMRES